MRFQLTIPNYVDYSGKKVLLGLSGGINSAAVLCWLAEAPPAYHPTELHLYYSHLSEHSDDTFRFVAACVRYARKAFPCVKFRMHRASALAFFEQQKFIPHPALSPCTVRLKTDHMGAYMAQNGITENVVGYVKEEFKRRASRMARRTGGSVRDVKWHGANVKFPIADKVNDWCFYIVKQHIGWYPAIYDIRDQNGDAVYTNNNCIPCKNWKVKQMKRAVIDFPGHMQRAFALSAKLNRHWGRDADAFYTEFGRDDTGLDDQPCEVCAFD